MLSVLHSFTQLCQRMVGQEHGFLSSQKKQAEFHRVMRQWPNVIQHVPVSFCLLYMFNFPFSLGPWVVVANISNKEIKQTCFVSTQKWCIKPGNCGSNWRPWCAVVPRHLAVRWSAADPKTPWCLPRQRLKRLGGRPPVWTVWTVPRARWVYKGLCFHQRVQEIWWNQDGRLNQVH